MLPGMADARDSCRFGAAGREIGIPRVLHPPDTEPMTYSPAAMATRRYPGRQDRRNNRSWRIPCMPLAFSRPTPAERANRQR
ncbi:hypothetical protein BO443_90133 [Burkholderia orbicola]